MSTYHQHTFDLEDSHHTFMGESITFRLHEFLPDTQAIYQSGEVLEGAKTFYAFEAIVGNEIAGYILLGYIDEAYKDTFFPTILDWYIHRFMDNLTKNQWLNHDESALKNVALRFDIDKENMVDLKQELIHTLSQSRHFAAYTSFCSYWVGKPNVEYSCVYHSNDKLQKDFSSYPFTHISREGKNFRSQGIAQKLYEVAADYLKTKNLYVYASTTQTEDGQKMWRIMENHPQFTMLSEALQTTKTTQRNELITQTRLKITTK